MLYVDTCRTLTAIVSSDDDAVVLRLYRPSVYVALWDYPYGRRQERWLTALVFSLKVHITTCLDDKISVIFASDDVGVVIYGYPRTLDMTADNDGHIVCRDIRV